MATTSTHFDPDHSRLLGGEIDGLLLQLRGLVLVSDLLADRGASADEIAQHEREADRIRSRLATLIGGDQPAAGAVQAAA